MWHHIPVRGGNCDRGNDIRRDSTNEERATHGTYICMHEYCINVPFGYWVDDNIPTTRGGSLPLFKVAPVCVRLWQGYKQ